MSKTVDQQIEKSRSLIAGMRKHMSEGREGATPQEADTMERTLNELAEANAECERLRAELAPRVKHMNQLLADVKTAYADKKKTLKGCYPQERWADYGIPDKR